MEIGWRLCIKSISDCLPSHRGYSQDHCKILFDTSTIDQRRDRCFKGLWSLRRWNHAVHLSQSYHRVLRFVAWNPLGLEWRTFWMWFPSIRLFLLWSGHSIQSIPFGFGNLLFCTRHGSTSARNWWTPFPAWITPAPNKISATWQREHEFITGIYYCTWRSKIVKAKKTDHPKIAILNASTSLVHGRPRDNMSIEQRNVERRNSQISISDEDKPGRHPTSVNISKSTCKSKTYMVPLITGAVLFPKMKPGGCVVVALVPLTLDSGVYVVFNCEIHAANWTFAGQQMPCNETRKI